MKISILLVVIGMMSFTAFAGSSDSFCDLKNGEGILSSGLTLRDCISLVKEEIKKDNSAGDFLFRSYSVKPVSWNIPLSDTVGGKGYQIEGNVKDSHGLLKYSEF